MGGDGLGACLSGRTGARLCRRGPAGKARRLLAALEARPYISPVDVATIHVGLGERDQAFEWLERALKERAYGLVFLPTDPRFDPVRSDPRFTAVMRRWGCRSEQDSRAGGHLPRGIT